MTIGLGARERGGRGAEPRQRPSTCALYCKTMTGFATTAQNQRADRGVLIQSGSGSRRRRIGPWRWAAEFSCMANEANEAHDDCRVQRSGHDVPKCRARTHLRGYDFRLGCRALVCMIEGAYNQCREMFHA